MERTLGAAALAALLAACGASTPPPESRVVLFTVLGLRHVAVAEGATALDPVCFAEERCDGLDSDCDGRIDETCEAGPPDDLEVGLAWNDASSLSVVLEPDLDAAPEPTLPGCDDASAPRRIVRRAHLAAGSYRIAVRRTSACPALAGTVATVAVAVHGQPVGVYSVPVAEHAEVLSFSIVAAHPPRTPAGAQPD